MCITLSATNSFNNDFSFLSLEAVYLYILCSAIFLFRLGAKENMLGTYAGDKKIILLITYSSNINNTVARYTPQAEEDLELVI